MQKGESIYNRTGISGVKCECFPPSHLTFYDIGKSVSISLMVLSNSFIISSIAYLGLVTGTLTLNIKPD